MINIIAMPFNVEIWITACVQFQSSLNMICNIPLMLQALPQGLIQME